MSGECRYPQPLQTERNQLVIYSFTIRALEEPSPETAAAARQQSDKVIMTIEHPLCLFIAYLPSSLSGGGV